MPSHIKRLFFAGATATDQSGKCQMVHQLRQYLYQVFEEDWKQRVRPLGEWIACALLLQQRSDICGRFGRISFYSYALTGKDYIFGVFHEIFVWTVGCSETIYCTVSIPLYGVFGIVYLGTVDFESSSSVRWHSRPTLAIWPLHSDWGTRSSES